MDKLEAAFNLLHWNGHLAMPLPKWNIVRKPLSIWIFYSNCDFVL